MGNRFTFESEQPTPSVFLVRPEAGGSQRVVEEHWETEPLAGYHDYRDLYGNVCRRATLPTGPCALRYDAVVETLLEPDPVAPAAIEHFPADLPDEVLLYNAAEPLLSLRCPFRPGAGALWRPLTGVVARSGDLRLGPRADSLFVRHEHRGDDRR